MWRNVRFRLHSRLGRYPGLLFPLRRLLGRFEGMTVTADSDLLIEGFPRSGSTFCYYAFLQAQPRAMSVAFHLHVPAHVLRAAGLKVPALVLIRQPADAVGSLILREPQLSVTACLERYLMFYGALAKVRHAFVLAKFADVITDFGATIERLNDRFGTAFMPFEHTERNLAVVDAMLDQRNRRMGGEELRSYRPNEAKEAAKMMVDFSRAASLLERCEALYARFRLE